MLWTNIHLRNILFRLGALPTCAAKAFLRTVCFYSCQWVTCPWRCQKHRKRRSLSPSKMLNDTWLPSWWQCTSTTLEEVTCLTWFRKLPSGKLIQRVCPCPGWCLSSAVPFIHLWKPGAPTSVPYEGHLDLNEHNVPACEPHVHGHVDNHCDLPSPDCPCSRFEKFCHERKNCSRVRTSWNIWSACSLVPLSIWSQWMHLIFLLCLFSRLSVWGVDWQPLTAMLLLLEIWASEILSWPCFLVLIPHRWASPPPIPSSLPFQQLGLPGQPAPELASTGLSPASPALLRSNRLGQEIVRCLTNLLLDQL